MQTVDSSRASRALQQPRWSWDRASVVWVAVRIWFIGAAVATMTVGMTASALPSVPARAGLAQTSSSQSASQWTAFQGGPAHLGATDSGPVPPLKVVWRSGPSGDARLSSVALVPGLAVATGVKSVVGFDPSAGTILWAVDRAQGTLIPPAVEPSAGAHGVIVFTEGAGVSGAIAALDLSTHARLWRVPLPAAALGAPAISEGHVLVGSGDGFVYSVDATNGSVLWKSKTDGVADTAPAAGDGKVFAVAENASSGRARLYAFDAATGRTAWSYSPGRFGVLASSPSVIPGTVFEAFGDRSVVALDTAKGSVRWKQEVRGDFAGTSAPAYSGGDLFVVDREGGLYRLDAKTGKRRWDYQFSAFSAGSAPLVVGATIFQGLDDGTVAAVSVATGHLRWQTKTGRGPVGPLTPAGDLLLAPAQGPTGGILAFQHDPAGALLNLPSPSALRPGIALRNFGAAFALMLIGILAFFRLLLARRPRPDEGHGDRNLAEDEGTDAVVPEGDR